jgi:formate dehydrogenase subunit delta
MNGEKLIGMANQIGDFFGAMPDRGQAVADIAGHLRRMWDPRMRRDLYAFIDRHGTDGLQEIVRDAVLSRRHDLEPITPVARGSTAR